MPDSSAPAANTAPVSLFYSYAHKDAKLHADFQRHLGFLEQADLIHCWGDPKIVPGKPWDATIRAQLERAELVLLLLSSHFIASDYIKRVELTAALQRAAQGTTTVVPILLSPLDLGAMGSAGSPLAALLQYQGLPQGPQQDWKAVTTWRLREQAWVSVSMGLRKTVADIQARRAAAPPGTPQPAHADPAPPNPRFRRALKAAAAGIADAQTARGGVAPDMAAMRQQALALIGSRQVLRLLWVDDHPENNVPEAEMLARLQIEVVQVTSTADATARLHSDAEPFDMVISDWHRGAEAPDAGLRLQQELTALRHRMPMVIYHAAFSTEQRLQRAASAHSAGVFGEAVLPSELLHLVQAALKR